MEARHEGRRLVLRIEARRVLINRMLQRLMEAGAQIHRVEYDVISPLFEEA